MATANDLLGDRRARTVGPVVAQLEGLLFRSDGQGFSLNFQAMSALDALRAVLDQPTSTAKVAPNHTTALTASLMLYELGVLQVLPYQVEQGEADVVSGLLAIRLPRKTMLTPHFPLTRNDHLWTRWTHIAYNRGPDLHTEPAFHNALTNDDAEASVPAMAAKTLKIPGYSDIGVLPIINAIDRQMFKAHAPSLAGILTRMPKGDIKEMQALLDAFTYYADDTIGPNAKNILRAPVKEIGQRLQGYSSTAMLSRLVINQQPGKTIPLAWRDRMNVCFPAQLSRILRRLVLNYRTNLAGDREMKDLASDCFERVVSRVLHQCSYETIHDGRELISIATHKGGLNEVDVFAWNRHEVLLVEAKFEIDPPGGWTPSMVKKRRDELEDHINQHQPKAAAWDAHLRQPSPTARFHPGDELVKLPPRLLDPRSIRLLIVSGRVEPAVTFPIEVVTFMPPLAAALAQRKLAGGRFCRIWDGRVPP